MPNMDLDYFRSKRWPGYNVWGYISSDGRTGRRYIAMGIDSKGNTIWVHIMTKYADGVRPVSMIRSQSSRDTELAVDTNNVINNADVATIIPTIVSPIQADKPHIITQCTNDTQTNIT